MLFLTNDVDKITELMGVSFDELNDVPNEEAFPVLLKSEYFHPYMFTTDKVEESKAIIEFRTWLQSVKDVPVREHNPIRTERIEQILGKQLKTKIDKIKLVLDQFDIAKHKFQGKQLLPYLGDYSPTNFSTSFPKFKSSFETDFEFMEFIVDSSVEEIAVKFKQINNI